MAEILHNCFSVVRPVVGETVVLEYGIAMQNYPPFSQILSIPETSDTSRLVALEDGRPLKVASSTVEVE